MNVSIVIPCYNEAKNIPLLVDKLQQIIGQTQDIEILLVNNGSKDNSASLLAQAASVHPYIRVVEVPINQGYGYGIFSGLRAARGTYLGWPHADLQTDPQDLITAVSLIQTTGPKGFVKGARKGRPISAIWLLGHP